MPNDLHDQFEHLFQVVSSSRFLNKEGLGNEVPFFIQPFAPADQNAVDEMTGDLITRLQNQGVSVLHIELYDLVVELINRRGFWQRVLDREPTIPKHQFIEEMQALTDPEEKITPAIVERMNGADFQVLFITGVGLVFPYLRSHNILNNLQKAAKDHPTVLFFPGEYNHVDGRGSYLKLFGLLPDDKYYRAFNIEEYRA